MKNSEWVTISIEDACELVVDCVNRTAPTVDYPTDYKMIRTSNVKNGFINLRDVKYVTEEIFKRWTRRAVPRIGDVILTREAPLGDVGMIRTADKVFLGQRIFHYRANPQKLDNRFLYYSLQGDDLQAQIKSYGSGSTVEHMRVPDCKRLMLQLPPLPTQRKIAAVISTYDDLILNNTRRIKILEEMAGAIYREWFVNFRFPGHEQVKMVESELGVIPQGWEVAKLGDLIENIKEKVKPGKHLEPFPYVPIDCIPRCSLALTVYKPSSEAKSSLIAFKRNDILFGAMRSYFHKVILAPFDGITRQTCFVLRSKNPETFPFNLFTTFQDSTVEYSSNHSTGSTIPYATWDGALAMMPIVKPPDLLMKQFSNIAASMLDSIGVMTTKNATLRRTRDLLLPKLISGEIDVSSLDIAID